MSQHSNFSTLCIHDGSGRDPQGAMHTPLYNHTTFGFECTQDVLDVIEGRKAGNLYTRFGQNPTVNAIERHLAKLEGGESALAFSAGMAAISATLMAYCQAGDEIITVGGIYGGTFQLLERHLSQFNIRTRQVPGDDMAVLEAAINDKTRVLYFETPTNPKMEIVDIAAVAKTGQKNQLTVVVDNTFASPANQSPLAWGADLVIHSATKYLGGHSDLTGGVVIGSKDKVAPIGNWRKNFGQMMAPNVAFLLERSLKTLAVRVERHNANAAALADFLNGHSAIRQVNYPGLPGHPGHEIAKRQMRGFGGMISFEYNGDAAATAAFVDRLKLFAIAPSLGGVESLITQPVTTTHHALTETEREAAGISGGLVRLSVGIEDIDDLIADLQQALEG